MTHAAMMRWGRALALIVLVGLAIRVTYALVHGDSRADLGIDAGYYHDGANLLADGKGFPSPVTFYGVPIGREGAQHPPAYQVALAAASMFGARSIFAHQLWSCMLGAAAVAMVGLAGREIAGNRAGLIAAGIAALYPNFWVNDVVLMSESLVVGVTALVVFLAYRFVRRPTIAIAIGLGLACSVAVLTRAEMVLLVPLLVVPLMLVVAGRSWRERARLLAVSLVASLLLALPWVAYNYRRFDEPIAISTGLGQTLFAGNCPDSYFGAEIGYWSFHCLLRPLPIPKGGDESVHDSTLRRLGLEYASNHAGRIPFVVFARLGRTWGFYAPLQQLRIDERDNSREFSLSVAGLGGLYVLAAGSIVGIVALRRRHVPVFPVLAPIVVVTITAALTYGQTRFRVPADVSLALLAAVAVDGLYTRWRVARRRSWHRPIPATRDERDVFSFSCNPGRA